MILGIVQARVSSSRLPKKVLFPLLGKPMILRQMERLRHARNVDRFIIATSLDPLDDEIEKLCISAGLGCFRGDLNDVLNRFFCAAKSFSPAHVVRITGDCPVSDPEVIEQVVNFFLEGKFDYASNTLDPTYPDGLDVEIFRFSCLEDAWREAKLTSEREHVTPFIYKHPERYRLGSFRGKRDLSRLRLTVDQAEDFSLVEKIYAALYPQNPNFNLADILDFLNKNRSLLDINSVFERNEGYLKSLAEDRERGKTI